MIQELILLVALMASAAIALEKISLKISEQESKLLYFNITFDFD